MTATTTAADVPLPDATVEAAWSTRNGRPVLAITGDNVPAAVTTVRATWQGTRRVDGAGRLLRFEHKYVYDAVREGATYAVRVSFRIGGRWDYVHPFERPYSGAIDDTYRSHVTEVLTVKAPEVAGRTLPVRLELVVRYPEPCARIEDAFTVLP